MNRVVITGIGVASPVGPGCEAFWNALTAGRSGIGRIATFDAGSFPVRIAGEVRDLDREAVARIFSAAKGERDRKIWLGLTAGREAVADAAIDAETLKGASLHVGVGLESFFLEDITPAASQDRFSTALIEGIVRDQERPALQTPLDRLATLLGDAYGITGGRWTNCSACAAGAQAIGEAFHEVREGGRRIAIAGAADSMINPLGFGGFSLLRVLSAENDAPTTACRPFDATRQGTVLAEGAAFLVLETLAHARGRGAKIYAELLGYGSSLDAFRVSDPEPTGRGAVLSMQRAIRDAGLRPEDVDAVNAHGTGTPKNDAVETAALKEVLGSRARQVPVHAVKSMTGHMIAASGAAEAVAATLTLCHGIVPPTINLRMSDPECDLDYVAEGAREFHGRTVLTNSFGFGGQNATLIFGADGDAGR